MGPRPEGRPTNGMKSAAPTRPRHAISGHEFLEHAAGFPRHLGVMIPDLLDRQWNSGIQRVELDHGREQGETLHVTVELARKQKRGLQDRRQEGILLGRNKNALHVVGRLTATLPCSSDITGLASVRVEPISKSPEEDNEASELYEAEEVLGVVFPTDEDAALPLNPSKEALHEPASHIAA